MKSHNEQRQIIQHQVNEYFGSQIDITPRAMAALQGTGCEYFDDEYGNVVWVESVFKSLLSSSPACLIALHNSGIDTSKLSQSFCPSNTELGPLAPNTLRLILEGHNDALIDGFDWIEPACIIEEEISNTKRLTEIDLFCAMLQTAYTGPTLFREYVDPREFEACLSDIGTLLFDAGFTDLSQIDEGLDEEERYYAIPQAVLRFKELTDKIKKIDFYDPSHSLIQFALYYDSNKKVRIRPFGVSSIGITKPEFFRNDQVFRYRNNILQPVKTLNSSIDEDSISVLEDMVNSRSCSEADFQKYFEHHPDFLLSFSYQCAHPQLILSSDENSMMIPDFFLEPLNSTFCDILELKLPYTKLVCSLRKKSRVRFRAFVNEAISQLVEYQRYFDNKKNRVIFNKKYGLDAYKPKMILVIGRSHDFKEDIKRRELNQLLPNDLEMWTYDDLLHRAKRFSKFIK